MVTVSQIAATMGLDTSRFLSGLADAQAQAEAFAAKMAAMPPLTLGGADTAQFTAAAASADVMAQAFLRGAQAGVTLGAMSATLTTQLGTQTAATRDSTTALQAEIEVKQLSATATRGVLEALAAASEQTALLRQQQAQLATSTGAMTDAMVSATATQRTQQEQLVTSTNAMVQAMQVARIEADLAAEGITNVATAEQFAAANAKVLEINTRELNAALAQLDISQMANLADGEILATQGSDLLAASQRNLATSITATNEQVLVATANLNANAEANERNALAQTENSSKTVGLGNSLGILAVGAALGGAAIIKMGMDFQSSLVQIQAFAGVSQQEMGKVRDFIEQLSTQTGASTKDIATGFYLASSSGLAVADAMTVVAASTKVAVASQTDAKVVIDAVTSALSSYHRSASDTGDVIDTMAAAVTAGKMQWSDFAGEVGKVLPLAAPLGIGLNQVSASIAEMTQKGMTAPMAFAAFRGELIALEAPSTTTVNALKNIGLSLDDLRQMIAEKGLLGTITELNTRVGGQIDLLKEIFPRIQGLTGVLAEAGKAGDDYAAVLGRVNASYGVGSAAAQTYSETSTAEIRRFVATAKVDLTDLGTVLGDAVAGFLKLPAPIRDAALAIPLAAAAMFVLNAAVATGTGLVGAAAGVWTTFEAQIGVVTAALAGEAAETEVVAAATTGLIPEVALLSAVIVGLMSAFGAFSSGADDTTKSEKAMADATARATKEVNDFVQAQQKMNTPTSEILDQLNAKMIAAETIFGEAQQKVELLHTELQLLAGAALGNLSAVTELNTKYGFHIKTMDDVKQATAQVGAQTTQNNQVMDQASADATKYGVSFKELTIAQQNEAQAQQENADRTAATIQQYGIATNSNFELSKAKQALITILKQEQDGTIAAATVQQDYAKAQTIVAQGHDAVTKAITDLTEAAKNQDPAVQADIKLMQDLLLILDSLSPSLTQAVVNTNTLTDATTQHGAAVAGAAGHIKDLEQAVDAEKSSQVDAIATQATLTQARQIAQESQDQQKKSLDQLDLLIQTSTGNVKTHYEELRNLVTAYTDLTPQVADAIVRHQELANTFGIAKQGVQDLRDTFPDLIDALHQGALSANEFRDAVLNMTSKPTIEELNLKQALDQTKQSLAANNAELANSSPLEQRIAKLQELVLQDQASGVSATQLANDQAELAHQVAYATSLGDGALAERGIALGTDVTNLKQQQNQQQSNLDTLQTTRQSLNDTVTVTQAYATGSAVSMAQAQRAVQESTSNQVSNFQGVANKAGPAGRAAGEANTQQLAASMTAGLGTLNDTLAQLPAKLAQALTDPQKFADAMGTNVGDSGSGLVGGVYAADPTVQNAGTHMADTFGDALNAELAAVMLKAARNVLAGGQVIAGLASAAGTPGSRSTRSATSTSLAYGDQGFFYPTEGPITQGFGENGEKGIDISVATGTPLATGISGKIVNVQAPSPEQAAAGLGYWVTIDAGNGLQEVIGHMDSLMVQLGQTVNRGDVIGISGGEFQPGHEDSNISTGPHTEVQVLINGGLVNPESVLGRILQSSDGGTVNGGTLFGGAQGLDGQIAQALNAASSSGTVFGGAQGLLAQLAQAFSGSTSTATAGGTAVDYAPGSVLNAQQIAGLLQQAGATVAENTVLTAIALAESGGGDTGAVSSVGAQGLFQFMPATAAGVGLTNPFDPAAAAAAAVQLLRTSPKGFSEWDVYDYDPNYNPVAPGTGAFTAYLPQAEAAVGALGTVGPNGPNPAPALASANGEAAMTRDLGQANAAVTSAENHLAQLQQRLDDLTTAGIPAAYQQQVDAAAQASQYAIDAQNMVLDAAVKVQNDIVNGEDDATLKVDMAALSSAKTQASAYDETAGTVNAAWNKIVSTVTGANQAIQQDTEKSNAALGALAQHNAEVAAGQADFPTQIGAAYQQAADTALQAWMQVGLDMDTLQQAMVNGADASTVKALQTTLASDTQRADSADKAANASFQAWDKEYKAEAQARKDLDTAIRQDVQNEASLIAGVATSYTTFSAAVTELSQTMGSDWAAGSATIVQSSHDAAQAAEQAYHVAAAQVIQDEDLLTTELTAQDRQRLMDKLNTDKDISASALQSAQEQEKAFASVADAFAQMNATMRQAAKDRLGLDASGFSDFTAHQLSSIGLVADAQTTADEARLSDARATYDQIIADSGAASQQLIQDQNDYNAAVQAGDSAEAGRLDAAISADKARIAVDAQAAQAIVQQYGTIQQAAQASAQAEMQGAKDAATERVKSLESTRDATLQSIADQKQALQDASQQAIQNYTDQAQKQAQAAQDAAQKQIQAYTDAAQQQKQVTQDAAQAAMQVYQDQAQKQAQAAQDAAQTAMQAYQDQAQKQAQAARDAAQAAIQAYTDEASAQRQAMQEMASAAQAAFSAEAQARKQALADATQSQKTAVDSQTQAQIDALQAQLDQEQKVKNTQKLADLEAAVASATSADAQKAAQQALTAFQMQLHDQDLQQQIQDLQTAQSARDKALDQQAATQQKADDAATAQQQKTLDAQTKAALAAFDQQTKAREQAMAAQAKTAAQAFDDQTKAQEAAMTAQTKAAAQAFADQTKAHEAALAAQTKAAAQAFDAQTKAQTQAMTDQAKAAAQAFTDQTTAQKQAMEQQTKNQKEALDAQAAATKNQYNDPQSGMIAMAQQAITAIETAMHAHYAKQESDAVADAKQLLATAQHSAQGQAGALTAAAPQFYQAGRTDYGAPSGYVGGATAALSASHLPGHTSATTIGTGGNAGYSGPSGAEVAIASPWFGTIANLLTQIHGDMTIGPGVRVQVVTGASGGSGGGGGGGLTVNTTVNITGDSAAGLQAMVQQAVTQAINDALRQGTQYGVGVPA